MNNYSESIVKEVLNNIRLNPMAATSPMEIHQKYTENIKSYNAHGILVHADIINGELIQIVFQLSPIEVCQAYSSGREDYADSIYEMAKSAFVKRVAQQFRNIIAKPSTVEVNDKAELCARNMRNQMLYVFDWVGKHGAERTEQFHANKKD